MVTARRLGTSTSRFGVSRRENHDSSDFYARFSPPELSADDHVEAGDVASRLVCGDARAMDLPADSVALVVTSPPYYAGKAYEEALGRDGVPSDYLEYLQLLREVFLACKRVLEPGGRIAVNVANLGRKPFRSLSADVVGILQDDLGLLLRGEIVWVKGEGASGSCAWGSFRSAANPVLRDTTERVIVASKGRFDRARSIEQRRAEGLPHRSTLTNDEFLEATLDLWRIASEKAKRVGHPAPFPVELPLRLIDLYTFEGDLVLDPFVGSGTTAVAAALRGRRWAGYDTDPGYIDIARRRLAGIDPPAAEHEGPAVTPVDRCGGGSRDPETTARIVATGKAAAALAADELERAGFRIRMRNHRVPGTGIVVSFVAEDSAGQAWYIDVTGAYTAPPAGLVKAETLLRAIGRAAVLAGLGIGPLLLVTTELPASRSSGDRSLRAVGPGAIFDAIELFDRRGQHRLAAYAAGGHQGRPLPGFWTGEDIAGRAAGNATPVAGTRR